MSTGPRTHARRRLVLPERAHPRRVPVTRRMEPSRRIPLWPEVSRHKTGKT